jgi:hypothetical protein
VEADAKARFIGAVLDGTLELRGATDPEIVEGMKQHNLPALSSSKGKDAKEDSVDGWEYLLRLRMDRVKASAVDDAKKAVAEAIAAVDRLQGTTAAQLWLADLDEFEVALTKMGEVRAAACSTGKRPPSKGSKGGKKN